MIIKEKYNKNLQRNTILIKKINNENEKVLDNFNKVGLIIKLNSIINLINKIRIKI